MTVLGADRDCSRFHPNDPRPVAHRRRLGVGASPAGEALRMDPSIEVAAYRITQEAITNVVRHSGASHCSVDLRFGGAVGIEIRDNGRGFSAARGDGGTTGLDPAAGRILRRHAGHQHLGGSPASPSACPRNRCRDRHPGGDRRRPPHVSVRPDSRPCHPARHRRRRRGRRRPATPVRRPGHQARRGHHRPDYAPPERSPGRSPPAGCPARPGHLDPHHAPGRRIAVRRHARGGPGLPAQRRRQHRGHRAIQAAARGEAVYGPGVAQRIIDFFSGRREPFTPRAFPELTSRECDILELLARGSANREIASRLGITDKTVRNHLS